MTAADWPALAARFEAATDETVYECVRDLLCFVTLKRGRAIYADTIDRAERARLPDLLLGVVVACVPSGWRIKLFTDGVETGAGFNPDISMCVIDESSSGEEVVAEAIGRPAALGAAVCRAWREVERKGEVG